MALSISPGVDVGTFYNDFPVTSTTGKIIVHKGQTTLIIDSNLLSQYLAHGWIKVNEGYAGVYTNKQSSGDLVTSPIESLGQASAAASAGVPSNVVNQTNSQTNQFDLTKYLPYILGVVLLIIIFR